VYQLITKVDNEQIKTQTLLLGDSVCREFFEKEKNDSVFCLCENQSYEVAGNYLLLKKLLANGSEFKQLKLIINPRTLTASINQKYTYNYFIKPFRKDLSSLDDKDQQYIQQHFPTRDFLAFRFSNYELPNAFDIYDNTVQDSLEFSEVNRRYLRKIVAICKANNIEFSLLCPPLPANAETYLDNFAPAVKKEFKGYFESVFTYESKFSNDGLHHNNSDRFILEYETQLDSLIKP